MDKKKNNKSLIWIIVILIILVLGLNGFVIYDKVLNKKVLENKKTTTTTKQNNDIDLNTVDISLLCKDNIEKIYYEINKFRNKSFIAKYYPEDYKKLTKESIKCNRTEKYDGNNIIIRVDFEEYYDESFTFNILNNTINGYDEMNSEILSEKENNILEAFNYAKDLVSEDEEKFSSKYPEFNVGTFKDENYNNEDFYILKVCKYEGEEEYCPEHFYDYKINFKDKTFSKINIDLE